jgi:hypothetical protein
MYQRVTLRLPKQRAIIIELAIPLRLPRLLPRIEQSEINCP